MKKLYLHLVIFLQFTIANAQISLVKDLERCCRVGPFEPLNNLVIFNSREQLWRTDGTDSGTTPLTSSAKFANETNSRCRVGNIIYFWANGSELWKTDGTTTGTVLVKSLSGSPHSPMVNLNGLLVFSFKTNAEGTEVWRSDGTDAGTYLVKDLAPGSADGIIYDSPQSAVVGGYFYFQGPSIYTGDPGFGYRPTLYRTNGTAAGTTLVANSGFLPYSMNAVGNRLVYQAYYPVTDTYGYPCFPYSPQVVTQFPTVLMVVENGVASVLKYPSNVQYCGKTPPIGDTFLNSSKFLKSSNYLYFIGQSEVVSGNVAYNLWRTDGTSSGTIQLTNFAPGSNEGPFGSMFSDRWSTSDHSFTNIAYFPIYTNAEGGELWRSDGTPGGTYLLKDINPGPNGSGLGAYNGTGNPNNTSGPLEIRTVNGTTYFFANDGTNGLELWKTDGTANGTQMVQNLNPGTRSQPISNLWNDNVYGTSVGNTYYFYGDNGNQLGLFSTSTCPSTPSLTITATPSLTIVQGATTTLKAAGAATYVWSNGAKTASIVVSQAGSYSVTGTSSGGCPATASVEVVAVPPLLLTTSTTAGALCVGGTADLSVAVSGGTPPYSYTWSTPSGTKLSATNTPTVSTTLTTAGTKTFTVRVASAGGTPVTTTTLSVTANALPTPKITGTLKICAGQSTQLTASGGSNYQWSDGQSGASIVVSPLVSTAYSVTVINESGCQAVAKATVSVNARPKVVITTKPALIIAAGSSATLTASGASSYGWSTGETTPAIVVTDSGPYSVTGSVSTGCSATTLVEIATVSPLVLSPSASVNVGCVSTSGRLTTDLAVAVSGGVPPYSYTWVAPSGVTLSTKNTETTSATLTAGVKTITIRVASADGAPVSTATISLTANALPKPTITGDLKLCLGESTTLAASGGVDYQWSDGQSGASIDVSPSVSTVYSVTATNESGCRAVKNATVSVSALHKVVIKGTPTSLIIKASGGSATLTASGATSYVWNNGATGASIVVSESGPYSVTGTNSGGCTATATAVVNVTGAVANGPSCDTYSFITDALNSSSIFVRSVYVVGNTIYVATDGGLSISTNGGSTFTTYTTANGLGSNTVFRVYVVSNKIYAATTNGLSISTDGGAHFTTTTTGLGSTFVTGVYAVGSTVFASTLSGLGISTNGGTSFSNKTTDNGLGHNTVYSVYEIGNTIYAATAGGVSISTNGGASFTNTSVGTGSNYANSVFAVGSTIYAGTYGGGLSISTNNGTTYSHKTTDNGLGSNIVWGVYVLGNTVYASTATGLSISTNGGGSFTNHYLNGHGVYGSSVANNIIYAATDGGLAFCSSAISPRLAAAEPIQNWQVRVLGNPPVNEYAEIELRDGIGQQLVLRLNDASGHELSVQSVAVENAVQRVRVRLGSVPAVYLLQVSDGVRKKTLRILRP
ncbi:hypothetical protein EXU85_12465 [Spirosoma sp. KCTC 42546]|uniref:hypothetical protein n=1 Tax=Spirosoma sp. KCTC 42546 TaxID=2520506 RepID=UPI00115792BB|nr:hypothetical protein [Spirosoma sp. KCTC 42546]QDK79369.1 hypothetical protein EXU85_12465 [Spirosoma sp. KCTC 42546]